MQTTKGAGLPSADERTASIPEAVHTVTRALEQARTTATAALELVEVAIAEKEMK